MSDTIFYNRTGQPICYLSGRDDETIFLFNGTPIAYIYNTSVYSFRGQHLGWYENGWIYDNSGYCIFYTEYASGGPVKPVGRIAPVKGITRVIPIKSVKSIPPVRPIKRLQWGDSDDFFD